MKHRINRWRPSYYPMGVPPEYPPMMYRQPSSVEDLREMAEFYLEIAEDIEKKTKEKAEKEKKPEAKKGPFSGGESLGLIVIYSLISGAVQYWLIASMLAK